MDLRTLVLLVLAGLLALGFAGYFLVSVKKKDIGTERMREISAAIREGAMAFLYREYRTLVVFVIVVTALLACLIHPYTGAAFFLGAICSALAGYLGMSSATNSNARTANAAKEGISKALRIAFSGGVVLGMSVVGIGLLGLSISYYVLEYIFDINKAVEIVAGFGFGASSIALFARVGGGIYTKAADVGADLVGKVEAGIPEDDPRNPAVIADNVGDNVGDIAGMGADLYESYVNSFIGAMTIGVILFGVQGVVLPLTVGAAGIVAAAIGTIFVRPGKKGGADFQEQTRNARATLNRGTIITVFLAVIATYFLVVKTNLTLAPSQNSPEFTRFGNMGIFYATLAGLIAGLLISAITEYYTSDRKKPVQGIVQASKTGPATNIIAGLALGMWSTGLPIIVVCIAIFLAYYFAGLYGIAMVAVGLLASLGMILSVDGYGPISDNAAGIAEMAGMGGETRSRAEALDSVGNTTAAIGKGFAICAAAFTAFALFWAYSQVAGLKSISIGDPLVLIGLFIGGMLPFLFCARTMRAVGKAASEMVNEVRRQFKEIKGLMEGEAKPDYKRCVDISTVTALKEMIIPSLLAVVTPILVGLLLGAEALGGLLAGAIVTGFLLAVTMANSGGAWDNAKKYIEAGNLGGKGSEVHKASVVGDTVGDPFKDTSGPSLNILIKLMSVVALVCAPLF